MGVAFLAAEWTNRPHTNPVVHAWVLNRESDDESALRAVGTDASHRWKWTDSRDSRGSYGLKPVRANGSQTRERS